MPIKIFPISLFFDNFSQNYRVIYSFSEFFYGYIDYFHIFASETKMTAYAC